MIMPAFDLTQRPFEGMIRDHFRDQIRKLAAEALVTKKNTCIEAKTSSGGELCLIFRPRNKTKLSGKVQVTWRDRGGIKEGWFWHDWTVAKVLKEWDKLMRN